MPSYGGYDYEFVDEIAQKYICGICAKALKSARLTECCGQHFCDSCLSHWQRTSSTGCPYCRTAGFNSVLNKEKIREIAEFRIRCTNTASGCNWVGNLGKLKNHLQSDTGCGYVEVTCSLSAYEDQLSFFSSHTWDCQKQVICGVKVERRFLAVHHELCKYRQYECEHCGYTDTYDAIGGSGQLKNQNSKVNSHMGNHYKTCDHFPLECMNLCGEVNIKRKDMTFHRDICPLEPLTCPFNAVLCKNDILRQHMEDHKRYCDFRPFSCKYCNEIGTFLSITGRGRCWNIGPSHYDKCGHFPLECVNKCGEMNILRKEMSSHCNSCPLEPLKCPLGEHVHERTILRKDMEKHKSEECEFRPYTCHYCNHTGTYRSITGKGETPLKEKPHYHVCEHYPLDCPKNCGAVNIKRKNMSSHQDKCPLEQLDCPFKFAKCTSTILRKDMDDHCQKNVEHHLLLVAQSHQELTQQHQHLAKSHRELAQSHQELADKNLELEQKNQELSDQVTRIYAYYSCGIL